MSAFCRSLSAASDAAPGSAAGGNSAARSRSSGASRANRPPPAAATRWSPATSSCGTTTEPWLSVTKPPSARGIGAPCSVPSASTLTLKPSPRSLAASSTSAAATSASVIARMSPARKPVWRNNEAALLRPDESELPCVGMIDVLTAPTSELMVRVSVVSGVTVNA